MRHPILFELSLSVYAVLGIAVVGPLLMVAMDRLASRAVARGWLERASAGGADAIGWADLRYMASFVLVTGVLAISAQFVLFHGRAIPLDLGVHPLEMLWFTTALMLVVDTNGFFWHRFSHRSPRAYRTFHSGHHTTRSEVHIAVAFHASSLWDYPLHSGVVLSVALSVLVLLTGHYAVVTIVYATSVYVFGVALTHSGLRETRAMKWIAWALLFPIKLVPTAIRLEDHLRHHARGSCNYGVFFSHWDRLLGSWEPSGDAARAEPVRGEVG